MTPTVVPDSPNDNDVDFLENMTGYLGQTVQAAHAVITGGQHPEVADAAHDILATHSAQMGTVNRLQGLLGVKGMSMGTAGTGTSGGGSNAGGNGIGGGYGGGQGHNSDFSIDYHETRAALSGASINNLPDSDFAYIEPGGQKDATGRTIPRSKRHFPVQDAAHVRNALSRAPQSPFGKAAMPKIMAAAKKFGIDTAMSMNSAQPGGELYREVPFQLNETSDGLTLEGYAAVFNSPTRIDSWEGTFDETISPGAFRDSLSRRAPVLMFEHGKHPLIGTMPLGVITRASEDSKGLHIQARLSDNWLIQPVRDAVRDKAVQGMSFRFRVPEGGDIFTKRSGDVDLRTISRVSCSELGPVVFPAYEPTTATIRSLLERIPILTGRPDAWSAGGGESGTDVPSPTDQQRLDAGALQTRGIR